MQHGPKPSKARGTWFLASMVIIRWKTSGNIVACLDAEQYHTLVLRGGSNVRNLKRYLCQLTGYSRFRQRIFDEANDTLSRELTDSHSFGLIGSRLVRFEATFCKAALCVVL